MRAGRDVQGLQAIGQREAQGIAQERRQDDDLPRRDPLIVNQRGDLLRNPIEHLGVIAVVVVYQDFIQLTALLHGCLARSQLFGRLPVQGAGQVPGKGAQPRAGDQ